MPFVKGQSGNPGGRPKLLDEVVAQAREYTKENIKRIADIAASSESDKVRLAASIALHEIAWGKPVQQQKVEMDATHHAGDTLAELMLRLRSGTKA